MNRLISSAISAVFISGLVSMSWADRPDGEPTCSFTGGAYYSSTNTLYLESFNATGAKVEVDKAAACVTNSSFNVVIQRSSALTSKSTLILPLKEYRLTQASSNCITMYEPAYMDSTEASGAWGLYTNPKNSGDPNKPMLLDVNVAKQGCESLKEIELTAQGFEIRKEADRVFMEIDHWVDDHVHSNGSLWHMMGQYEFKTLDKASLGDTVVYGYAAHDASYSGGKNVTAGQFVKMGTGATYPPLRFFLKYYPSQANKIKSNLPLVLQKSTEAESFKAPDTIMVFVIGKNDSTTNLNRLNSGVRELRKVDSWYDLNGRQLKGKPANKGMFVGKTRFQK